MTIILCFLGFWWRRSACTSPNKNHTQVPHKVCTFCTFTFHVHYLAFNYFITTLHEYLLVTSSSACYPFVYLFFHRTCCYSIFLFSPSLSFFLLLLFKFSFCLILSVSLWIFSPPPSDIQNQELMNNLLDLLVGQATDTPPFFRSLSLLHILPGAIHSPLPLPPPHLHA